MKLLRERGLPRGRETLPAAAAGEGKEQLEPPRESLSSRMRSFWSSSRDEKQQRVRRLASRGRSGLVELWRRYGWVAIGTYASLYVVTLGSVFAVFHFDVVEPELIVGDPRVAVEKIIRFIQKQEEHVPGLAMVEPYLEVLRDRPVATDLALAWLTAKLTEPARMLLTIGLTPRLARLAGRVPPPEEQEPEERDKTRADW